MDLFARASMAMGAAKMLLETTMPWNSARNIIPNLPHIVQ